MGSDLKSKDPCGEEMLQVGRVQWGSFSSAAAAFCGPLEEIVRQFRRLV